MAVMAISKDGRPLIEYPSIESAARKYGVGKSKIRSCINSGRLLPEGRVYLDIKLDLYKEDEE